MTKYPIILVHGIAFRETKLIRAFGKIESKLKLGGYDVYTAKTDAFGTIEKNAEQLKNGTGEQTMKLGDIEMLIWATENGVSVIEKQFYCDLVTRLKKSKRKDLLDRLLAITPYEKKEKNDGT